VRKIISENSGYKVLAGVDHIEGQPGMYRLQFSTQYASAANPADIQPKFEAYLTWSQLKELKSLLP